MPFAYGANPITHQITLPAGMSWCGDDMINGLFTQVNAFRAQNGAAALGSSTLGMKDAEMRAMQFAIYMQTHSPGSPGFDPHQGYDTTAASLGYNLVSENLAYMTIDPVYIVYAAWQDSLHIAAMLASDANVMGVSCVTYAGTAYWSYEPGSCASCGTTPPPPPPPAGVPTLDSEEWAFLTLINNYRAQNGLGSLQVSVNLENSALWMSSDMATKNYFSHTDSLGRTSGARFAAFNYPYTPWGENIAAGYADAQNSFNGWLNACDADASGTCTYAHRQNMLTASFKVIGIGRAFGSSSTYGWYWVTDFGGVVDQTITPPGGQPSAPTITSFSASPSTIVTGQSATLSWNVTGANTVSIDGGIGAVSGTGSKTVSPAQTTTYTLTATNAAGSITARATVTVGAAQDTQPPTAPTLTSVSPKSSTEADLSWTASSDNVGVAGYQILRNGSALTTVPASAGSFADTSVQAGATYAYSVKAFDAAGNTSAASNTVSVTIPAAPPSGSSCPAAAQGAFTGCYYNNLTLSGNPALTRSDSQINFDWGSSAPTSAVTAGNFSVRWQGNFLFTAGTYTFKALTSDGMRLYIDGSLMLDRWRDQASTFYSVQQQLAAGTHLITVEYYEHSGWSTAHVTWQNATPAVQPPTILSFSAAPASIVTGAASTLSWSVNGATTITIDNGLGDVSGLTSKAVSPNQTTAYTLTATNSAGSVTARTTVAVSAIQDTQPPTTPTLISAAAKSSNQVDLAWSASTDNVGVPSYQIIRNGSPLTSVPGTSYSDLGASPNSTYTYSVRATDAAGNFSAASNTITLTTPAPPVTGGACPAATSGAFTGCYYNNLTLSGNPALVRTDSQINFDWGTGSPAPAVTPDNFSARWQGYFTFPQGTSTFTVTASDGMRLYIDGNLVLDRWRDEAATMYTSVQTLSAGSHLITVEYYEHTGWPTAHLTWR
ncbi:MAG: Allergen V5/Tpx family protein [Candidatus Solibacter sp.]|nr:Allergen V5/Tpx family protein [Candidatus Solibacter sp.]